MNSAQAVVKANKACDRDVLATNNETPEKSHDINSCKLDVLNIGCIWSATC